MSNTCLYLENKIKRLSFLLSDRESWLISVTILYYYIPIKTYLIPFNALYFLVKKSISSGTRQILIIVIQNYLKMTKLLSML